MTDSNIQCGDTVAIQSHRRAPRLYPDRVYAVPASEGWVVYQIDRSEYDRTTVWMHKVAPLEGTDFQKWPTEFAELHYLTVQKKGGGQYIEGESVPFDPYELRRQRVNAFVEKFNNTPVPTKEGFFNAATWMAVLYLNQEPRWRAMLPRLQRKDGTINPDKVSKTFYQLGLKLDDWVYEPHIEVPEEFARMNLPNSVGRLGVYWCQVANEFSRSQAVAKT